MASVGFAGGSTGVAGSIRDSLAVGKRRHGSGCAWGAFRQGMLPSVTESQGARACRLGQYGNTRGRQSDAFRQSFFRTQIVRSLSAFNWPQDAMLG